MAKKLSYCFAIVCGLLYIPLAMPLKCMLGKMPEFVGILDQGQHYLGSLLYFAQPWSNGILSLENIDPNYSIPLGFFDSVPLFTFLVKVWNSFLPYQFEQSMDPFLAVCILLQPVTAVFALRAMGLTKTVPCCFIAILSLFYGPFIHSGLSIEAALSAHWLILLAIGLYFQTLRSNKPYLSVLWFVLLTPVSFYIHPYISAMVAIMMMCIPISMIVQKFPPQEIIVVSMIVVTATLLTAVLAYFGGYSGAKGVGLYYGMHPLRAHFLIKNDSFLPTGVIGSVWLLFIAMIVRISLRLEKNSYKILWKNFVFQNGVLIALSIGLIFFGFAGKLKSGHHVFMTWNTDWIPLHNVFRFSARFSWIVFYLMLLGAVKYWGEKQRKAYCLLLVACCLQIALTAKQVHWNHKLLSHFSLQDTLSQTPKGIKSISIFPSASCMPPNASNSRDVEIKTVNEIISHTLYDNKGLKISGGLYLARYYPKQLCSDPNIPAVPPASAYEDGKLSLLVGARARALATEWSKKGFNCFDGEKYNQHFVYLCHK